MSDGFLVPKSIPFSYFGHSVLVPIDSGATGVSFLLLWQHFWVYILFLKLYFWNLEPSKKSFPMEKSWMYLMLLLDYLPWFHLPMIILLQEIYLIIGINRLQHVKNLTSWTTFCLPLPHSMRNSGVSGELLDSRHHTGTVRVLWTVHQLSSHQDTHVQASIVVLSSPKFWNLVLHLTPGRVQFLQGGRKNTWIRRGTYFALK